MTIPAPSLTGHSAEVELTLILDAQRISLSSVGPSRATACEAVELAPGRGELEILVDGKRSVYLVDLPLGSVPYDRQISIRIQRPEGHEPAPFRPLPMPNDEQWYRSLQSSST